MSEPATPASLPLPGGPSLPAMASRRVRLRPIADRDSVFLYELMTSPDAGGRVRFAGATPSPEKVLASLWDSVLAQFIIERAGSERPLGLAAVTSANFRDGYAYLSALGTVEGRRMGLVAEGALLAFHYGFSIWPFRKIYMEASEESLETFRSAIGQLFVEEGRLREHAFWNGRYLDVTILAVYRETWAAEGLALLGRLGVSLPPPAPR